MSFHLPPPENVSVPNSDIENSSASSEDEEEETWDGWVSDPNTRQGCKSLFDDKILSCVDDAVTYDRENYKVDIIELCKRLCEFPFDVDLCKCTLLTRLEIYLALDFYGRVRLINFIRKNVGTVSMPYIYIYWGELNSA